MNALPPHLAQTVRDAMGAGDLDGHLCALLLRGTHDTAAGLVLSPWHQDILRVLDSSRPFGGGARDVALVGCRIALGASRDHAEAFVIAAKRELAREPMPPAACLRDEERFLLGVAAGIGVVAPDLGPAMARLLHDREETVSLRQLCVDLWAQSLARGQDALHESVAQRALQLLTGSQVQRAPTVDADRIAVFWLASRLLEAQWSPTDLQLQQLQSLLESARRAATQIVTAGLELPPIDCALLLDAWRSMPAARLERRTALQGVLAVIDSFPASAHVLAKRQRNRPPFSIADEHDVQDLFRAMVLPVVPDIVPEDPAPKVAGRSSRLDFTSKQSRLGFELKHLKSSADLDRARKEILLDEATYQEHPYVDTVVVFLSDPEQHLPLADRFAFEADLSKPVTVAGRTVTYITRVR